MNRDGKINITDITKIAAHIKGIKLIEVDGFVIPELEGLAG